MNIRHKIINYKLIVWNTFCKEEDQFCGIPPEVTEKYFLKSSSAQWDSEPTSENSKYHRHV